jgi:hypothetical protein
METEESTLSKQLEIVRATALRFVGGIIARRLRTPNRMEYAGIRVDSVANPSGNTKRAGSWNRRSDFSSQFSGGRRRNSCAI